MNHSNYKIAEKNYITETDSISKDIWNTIIRNFTDATIYQTYSYGAIRWGKENLSHLILKNQDEIIAAAQARIITSPLIGSGIAYITRGPVWCSRKNERNPDIFRQICHALYEEYVSKRKMFLRVLPNEFENGTGMLRQILEEEGFEWQQSARPYKTILKNLTLSLENLKKSLHKSWRENLRRSQRNGLEILEGKDDDFYGIFVHLYKQMYSRKKFISSVDIDEFRVIQNDLPENLKMNIMVCTSRGEPVAALVWSAIGDTGITILSATGNKGLKLSASYLLRWRLIERLVEKNCRFLDQGGIDRQLNPGGYTFKAGIGGTELCHIGQFNAYKNRISSFSIKIADQLRTNWQKMEYRLNRLNRTSFL